MNEAAWRNRSLREALAGPELASRLRAALATGPLCDDCLGRLVAQVDTGLGNRERGRLAREALAAPSPAATCSLCRGLFADIEPWAAQACEAVQGWEYETIAVSSFVDPALAGREKVLWQVAGQDLAEPYKQAFNRMLGIRVCDLLHCGTDLKNPDIIFEADHRRRTVAARIEPLFLCGRYRKLVRGISQSRWRNWPTSVQDVLGNPIQTAAGGAEQFFHGCGREDVDVLCLGERPFVLEVALPRRRRLDLEALSETINRSGKVEVLDLARCCRRDVEPLKALRPEKSYRAIARLGAEVDDTKLAALASLVGPIRQHTPVRVLTRRADMERERHVLSLEWRRVDALTVEIFVRTQAGTYIKELISSDGGRTRPSVAEVLGVPAECIELDVTAIHL